MSTQAIESVLSRAMSDAAFADLLRTDPEKALAGYDLTPDEAASFKDLIRETLSTMAQVSPEERKSFGIWSNHNESAVKVGR